MPTPKQRVLVRWNDDLDKALLLFVTHTCNEMGIKIPYEEVARRMGSTFSAGAIQQHITKLRNKMADANVVPVPPPPGRGRVTCRPSKSFRAKTTGTPQSVSTSNVISPSARKAGKKRRVTTTRYNDSDIEADPADFENDDEEDEQEEYVLQAPYTLKRKRNEQAQHSQPQSSRVSNARDQFDAGTPGSMQLKQEADDEWDDDLGTQFVVPNFPGYDSHYAEFAHNNLDPVANTNAFQLTSSDFAFQRPADEGEFEDEAYD